MLIIFHFGYIAHLMYPYMSPLMPLSCTLPEVIGSSKYYQRLIMSNNKR